MVSTTETFMTGSKGTVLMLPKHENRPLANFFKNILKRFQMNDKINS